jgi:hypothetical protein
VLAAIGVVAAALLLAIPTALARQQPDKIRAKGECVQHGSGPSAVG